MIKIVTCALFVLCLFSGIFAQEAATFEADTARANALWNEAVELAGTGQFRPALEKMDTAEILQARTLGPESIEIAKILFGKAVCHFNLADYARSTEYFQQCLAIRERLLGETHQDVAMCHVGLGNTYQKTGDYEKALDHFNHFRAAMVALHGPESVEVVKADMSIAGIHLVHGDYAWAESAYLQGLALLSKVRPPGHPDLAKLHTALSTVYQRTGEFAAMLEHSQKGLEILSAVHPPDALPMIEIYKQNGVAYAYMNDARNAEYYLNMALEIIVKTKGAEHLDAAACYTILAGAKSLQGDHAQAIEHTLRAADIFAKKVGRAHSDVAVAYSNAGEYARRLGDNDQALRYLRAALDILSEKGQNALSQQASIHLNIGAALQDTGDFDAALMHYDTAMGIWDKQPTGQGQPGVAIVQKNIGLLHVKKADYPTALEYLKTALTKRLNIYGAKHPDVAESYSELVEVYRLRGMFAEGAHYADSALVALRYGSEADFDRVQSVPTLLNVLLNKGALYFTWFQRDSLVEHLYSARQAFAAAAQAVAYQDRYLEVPDSKFTLSADAGKVAVGGIAVAHSLYIRTDSLHYAHEAFDYAQKSKALVLYGSMQEANAVRFAGLPDSLLERERQLRVELAYLERKRQERTAGGLPETDSAALVLSTRIFDLRQHYSDLTKHLERTFPNYHHLRYDRSTITVREVQEQLLRPDQTLVEYVVGDSTLFVFVVGKQTFLIREIPKNFPLEAWVTDLRAAMTTNRSTGAAQYCERAFQLYQKLVAPVQDYLTEEVVIVPDGVLNYLPFEALLTQMPAKVARFRTHDYLLYRHRIGYSYSATLLREMQGKRRREALAEHLLALAPYYSGDSVLLAALPTLTLRKKRRALRHSGGEVYGIRRIMGGDVLHGQAATKEHFQQIAGKYRILHLATHGQANERVGDYSLLAFAETPDSTDDNLLYVRDIYNLPLGADLVTLSACETGIGKLQRGEGVISVARAFAYAGASSIVTALWDVEDEHAKELMLVFYKELRKGSSKNEALQTAKRSLAKRPGSHPFFWAAFIAIGDMRPLPQLKN